MSSNVHKVVESIEPYVTNWWFICIGGYVLFSILSWINKRILMKKLGAKPIQFIAPDPYWGIPLMFTLLRKKKEGTMVDMSKERYDEFGVDTFGLRVGGTSVITTKDPENIKAILATQFNDFAL